MKLEKNTPAHFISSTRMTIYTVSTVFGIQISKIRLLKIILGNEEWKSEIHTRSVTQQQEFTFPTLEEIEEYENQPDTEEKNEDLSDSVEQFFNDFILHEWFREISPYFFKGGRHEHDESELVLGVTLFDSSVEGPGSTSSFSMEDFDEYQKKISDCKETIKSLIGEDQVFDMFSVADDCQCCS